MTVIPAMTESVCFTHLKTTVVWREMHALSYGLWLLESTLPLIY